MGDRAAVESLYKRESGRGSAYCYARLGSRSLAEWAVAATFDRARDQAADGGLPDHELDWLLRTADKFCSPRLKLGARRACRRRRPRTRRLERRGFDQIAAELDAHRARLEAAQAGALAVAPPARRPRDRPGLGLASGRARRRHRNQGDRGRRCGRQVRSSSSVRPSVTSCTPPSFRPSTTFRRSRRRRSSASPGLSARPTASTPRASRLVPRARPRVG